MNNTFDDLGTTPITSIFYSFSTSTGTGTGTSAGTSGSSGQSTSSSTVASGQSTPSGTPVSGQTTPSGTPASGQSTPVSGQSTPSGTPASGQSTSAGTPASGQSTTSGTPVSGQTTPSGTPASGQSTPSGTPVSGQTTPSGTPVSGQSTPSGTPVSGQTTSSGTPGSTTTGKYCDEMEYITTLIETNSVKTTPTDIPDKEDLITKGVDFTDNKPTFVINVPNGGAIVRDIQVPSKNVAEIEVTFTTVSGKKTTPIQGAPTSIPTDNFPTEKVIEVVVKVTKTTDNKSPKDVTLSVIACAEGTVTTTPTGNIL